MPNLSEILLKLALQNETMVQSNMSGRPPQSIPDPVSGPPWINMPDRNMKPGMAQYLGRQTPRDKHDPGSWLKGRA